MDARFTNPFGLVGVPINGDGAGGDVSAGGGKNKLPQPQPQQQQPPNVTAAPNMNVFGSMMMMSALAGSNWSVAGNGVGVGLAQQQQQQQQQQNPIQQQTTQPQQQQQVLTGVGGAGFSVGGTGSVGLQQQQIGQQGGKSDSGAAAGNGGTTMNAGGNASVSSQQAATATLPQQLVFAAAGNAPPAAAATTTAATTAAPFPFPPQSGMVIDPQIQQQQQIMANLWLNQLAQQAQGGATAAGGGGINYPGAALLGALGGQQQQPQQQLVEAPVSSASTTTNTVSSSSPANEGANSGGGEAAGGAASSAGGGGVGPVLLADASAAQLAAQQQQLQLSGNAPFMNDGNVTKQGTSQVAASSAACWNPIVQQSQQQTLSTPQSGVAEKSSSDMANSTAQQPVPLTMAMATMAPLPTSSSLTAMGANPLVAGWIQQQQQQQQQSVDANANFTTQVQPGQRKRQRQQQQQSQTQTSSVPSIVVPAVPPMAVTADMLQGQQAAGAAITTNGSTAASGEQTSQPDRQQLRSDVVMPPGENSGGGALRPLSGPPALLVTGDSSASAAACVGVGGAGDGGGGGQMSRVKRQSESAPLPPHSTADTGGRYRHKTARDAAEASANRSADDYEGGTRRQEQDGWGKRAGKAGNPDDDRRQSRNQREQERSKKITNQIMELRSILTSSKIPYQPNKFSILQSVCGYVKQLQNHAALLDAERAKLVRTLAQTTEMMECGGGVDGGIAVAGGGAAAAGFGAPPPSPSIALSSSGGGIGSRAAGAKRSANDADMLIVNDIDYRNLFHRCGMALGVATLDGRFIDCNKEFEVMSGYDREELLTLSVFHMFSNDDEMEEVFATMGQMLKEEDELGREPGTGNGDAVSGGGLEEREGDGGNEGLPECQTYWSGNVETIPPQEGNGIVAEDPEEENQDNGRRPHRHQLRVNITLARSGDGMPKFFNIALTTRDF